MNKSIYDLNFTAEVVANKAKINHVNKEYVEIIFSLSPSKDLYITEVKGSYYKLPLDVRIVIEDALKGGN